MKYLLRTFAISALIALNIQTQAQVKLGVKAGLNINNISQNFKESDLEYKNKMSLGYNIGVTVDFGLIDALCLQSGLMLTSKGFSYDLEEEWGVGTEGYDRVIYNYLEVPVNFAYKINDFQIYAGPYLAIGIGGKNKWNVTYDGASYADEYKYKPVFGEVGEGYLDADDDAYSALDYGINFGAGYQIGPMLINAGYSLGLGNLTPAYKGYVSDRKDFKVSNRVISLSVSYFFGE
ncbi:MAG: porin family protein [Bacteroidales bacterium]|nr:porin family protein [Bacteroidales bacterium]